MSDFLTRLIQRQQGQMPTVQPRVPSVFAPVADRQDVPMPEVPAAHQLAAAWERGLDGATEPPANGPSRRILPSADPTAHPGPLVGSLNPKRPAMRPHLNEPAELSPTMENMCAPMRISPEHFPIGTDARVVPSKSGASEPTLTRASVSIDMLDHAQPFPVERIELPPRLVESRVESIPRTVAAPPSLVSAGFSGRRSEPMEQDVAEPPVQVTIGRIEVTAGTLPPAPKRKPAPRQPSMSLQDYLSRRQGRGT